MDYIYRVYGSILGYQPDTDSEVGTVTGNSPLDEDLPVLQLKKERSPAPADRVRTIPEQTTIKKTTAELEVHRKGI